MAEQKTLKKIKFDGYDVIAEVANRDGQGRVITATYATQAAVSGKQDALTAGTGIDISSNTISIKKATDSVLGGVKVSTGLEVANDGTLTLKQASSSALGGVKVDGSTITINSTTGAISVGEIGWSAISASSKPFNSVYTGTGNHFVVDSNNVLKINTEVFPTSTTLGNTYVAKTTYETFVNTTAPASYHPKIDSSHKLSYSLISGTPTKVSDFTNDSGFITASTDSLTNYYKKSETYTKTEVNNLVSVRFTYETASTLPTASADTMYKIYFVPASNTGTNNVKNEYITVRSGTEGSYTYAWELIGSSLINTDNYVSASATLTADNIILGNGNKAVKSSGLTVATSVSNSSTSVPRNDAVYTALGNKQNTLTSSNAGNGITITNGVIACAVTAETVDTLSW